MLLRANEALQSVFLPMVKHHARRGNGKERGLGEALPPPLERYCTTLFRLRQTFLSQPSEASSMTLSTQSERNLSSCTENENGSESQSDGELRNASDDWWDAFAHSATSENTTYLQPDGETLMAYIRISTHTAPQRNSIVQLQLSQNGSQHVFDRPDAWTWFWAGTVTTDDYESIQANHLMQSLERDDAFEGYIEGHIRAYAKIQEDALGLSADMHGQEAVQGDQEEEIDPADYWSSSRESDAGCSGQRAEPEIQPQAQDVEQSIRSIFSQWLLTSDAERHTSNADKKAAFLALINLALSAQ